MTFGRRRLVSGGRSGRCAVTRICPKRWVFFHGLHQVLRWQKIKTRGLRRWHKVKVTLFFPRSKVAEYVLKHWRRSPGEEEDFVGWYGCVFGHHHGTASSWRSHKVTRCHKCSFLENTTGIPVMSPYFCNNLFDEYAAYAACYTTLLVQPPPEKV